MRPSSSDYFEGDSVDLEVYDDAVAIATPMQALSLGSHTIGSANARAQSTQRQQPSNVLSPAEVKRLQAQLAESQAVSKVPVISRSGG